MIKLGGKLLLGRDLFWGYIKRHFLLFAAGLVVGLVFFVLLLPFVFQQTNRQRQVAIGLVGNYTTANLPLTIQERMSYGLTKLTTDGEAVRGASVSFVATDSGRKMVFELNPQLSWQDGTQFNSTDVNYNLKGVVTMKNDHSVTFNLKEPFAPLPAILSQPLFKVGVYKTVSFLPRFVSDLIFRSPLIGLGDYKLEEIKYNGRFLSLLTIKSQTTGDILTYKFYPTQRLAAAALKLGQINQLGQIIDVRQFSQDPYFEVSQKTLPHYEAMLFFNLEDPLLQEKTFRQALIYALPDSFSQGKTTDTPMPESSWARSTLVKKYPQNNDLARETLDKVATKSADGLINLRLSVATALLPTAFEIRTAWEKVGVAASLETTETPSPKYQAYLALVPLPLDPDQYILWHSTQNGNIANYESFKVDRLLEEGRQTLDPKIRQQTYSDFQKAITEDAPAAFLFYPTVYDVRRKY